MNCDIRNMNYLNLNPKSIAAEDAEDAEENEKSAT
jgi:hypothetical protein